jgi:hypothetical protein
VNAEPRPDRDRALHAVRTIARTVREATEDERVSRLLERVAGDDVLRAALVEAGARAVLRDVARRCGCRS